VIKFIWEIIHSLSSKRNIDCGVNAMKLENNHLEWLQTASDEEKQLWNQMNEFRDLFEDMLFEEGTVSYELMRPEIDPDDDPDEERNDFRVFANESYDFDEELENTAVPYEQINNFDMGWFTVKVAELPSDQLGYYDHSKQEICISSDAVENETVLLHMMTHLYVSVINELHPYYHDMLCWALYQDLRKKIKWLDTAITEHAHRLNGTSMYSHTEKFDLLFLLKSFDLDIRQGNLLGTVFGCARLDLFDGFDYED